MQVGLLGFGKMGRIIADKLIADGHTVALWNRTNETLDSYRVEKAEYIVQQKLQITRSITELSNVLMKPRVIWTMLPAGEPTNTALQQLNEIVETGDLIIDGGNSHFTDTERWAGEFEKKGIKFLGLGCSGGVHAIENGFCIMAGGNKEGYEYVQPMLDSLIKPYGAYNYFGTGGAGHFVKMVHNGIEYGLMQSLAEGFGVLAKSQYGYNLNDVVSTWQGGSIIESFLLDMAGNALTKDPSLSQVDGYISATGEGKWTIDQAKAENVPVPVIEQSLAFRNKSQFDKVTQDTFAAKLVSAMRREFGGHSDKQPSGTPTK
jgi:6-phosphogluconate dehydrogenase